MNHYLLIIIPPKNIRDFVNRYRERFRKFSIPPHITIYPPFLNNLETEEKLINLLKNCFQKIKPQKITIDHFNQFKNKNILFLEPNQKSCKYLCNLAAVVTNCLSKSNKEFRPHLTIANKMSNNNFLKIKEELSKIVFKKSFLVSSIYLYKQSDNSGWEKIAKIDL